MSLFRSFMGDLEEDPIFGFHMRQMSMMNSMFGGDSFGGGNMLSPFDNLMGGHNQLMSSASALHRNAMMPFNNMMPFPNMNRLLNTEIPQGATSFSSSRVVTMTQGPDGRPQVYQASSSTKTGPGGVRETQKSVQDSRSGVKKMAIEHHIGDRGHVIEREQNVRTGEEEERQDFINLDEDDAEEFNREFTERTRKPMKPLGITDTSGPSRRYAEVPAIMPAPSTHNADKNTILNRNNKVLGRNKSMVSPRRALRTPPSSPLTFTSSSGYPSSKCYTPPTTSIHPHPYNTNNVRRSHHRSMKQQQKQQQQQQQQQQQNNYNSRNSPDNN